MTRTALEQQSIVRGQHEDVCRASEALRTWVISLEGRQLWERHGTLSLNQICHILDETHAGSYMLLLSGQFSTLLSSLNHSRFQEKEADYRAAIEEGICFWYDGSALCHIGQSGQALTLVQTLPTFAPFLRHHRTRQR